MGFGDDYYSVDRIEDDVVVCMDEKGKIFSFPLDKVERGVKEGDMLYQMADRYLIDDDRTNRRRLEMEELQNRVFGG